MHDDTVANWSVQLHRKALSNSATAPRQARFAKASQIILGEFSITRSHIP
jgi:hypothetical protein